MQGAINGAITGLKEGTKEAAYVKRMLNGRALDVNGNPVNPSSPEAHIPLNNFKFGG